MEIAQNGKNSRLFSIMLTDSEMARLRELTGEHDDDLETTLRDIISRELEEYSNDA